MEQKELEHKILTAATGLVRGRGICKRSLAKSAKGNCVSPDSKYAIQFCAVGALFRVRDNFNKPRGQYDLTNYNACLGIIEKLGLRLEELGLDKEIPHWTTVSHKCNVNSWNDWDKTTTKDVVDVFESVLADYQKAA